MGFLESYDILYLNEEEDYEKSPPHMKSNVSPSAKAEGFVISEALCGSSGYGLLLLFLPVK